MPAPRRKIPLGSVGTVADKTYQNGDTVKWPHGHKKPLPGTRAGLGGLCGHPGGLASYTYGRCFLKHAVSTAPASTFTFRDLHRNHKKAGICHASNRGRTRCGGTPAGWSGRAPRTCAGRRCARCWASSAACRRRRCCSRPPGSTAPAGCKHIAVKHCFVGLVVLHSTSSRLTADHAYIRTSWD